MTEKVVWHVVKQYAAKVGILMLAPHDLRRPCARLCHSAGGEPEQIQFLLGMSRCRPVKNISVVKSGCGTVNDMTGIEPGP
jgi:site-specific recombinase XerD